MSLEEEKGYVRATIAHDPGEVSGMYSDRTQLLNYRLLYNMLNVLAVAGCL
jgi:hypothetical protein